MSKNNIKRYDTNNDNSQRSKLHIVPISVSRSDERTDSNLESRNLFSEM